MRIQSWKETVVNGWQTSSLAHSIGNMLIAPVEWHHIHTYFLVDIPYMDSPNLVQSTLQFS